MLLTQFFKKPQETHINATPWTYFQKCPRCDTRQRITAKDLCVVTIPDWGGERSYEFRAKCNCCKKLTMVVSKDRIPYRIKENVLAENKPIIDNGFLD